MTTIDYDFIQAWTTAQIANKRNEFFETISEEDFEDMEVNV